ncbi:MAG: phosphatase PAP2 family protein [Clostridia bacterium]|nr:phosphatase PAP2 family protein [Clostridia bacterium]
MVVSKKFIWGALIVFAVLMTVLAFGEIDYNFSNSIVNPDSGWAEFFNLFGEQPAFIALYAGILILYGARKRESKNILKTIVTVPFMLLASFQIVYMPVRYVYEHTDESIPVWWWIVIAVISVMLCLFGLFLANRIKPERFRKARKFGIILIILVAAEILVVNILKILWARPRMRSMDSIDQFKYWYQINGPSNDNELKSFPSGHTANGFVSIAFILFFNTVSKLKKNLYLAFAVVWGALVALSRVVRGDHFLSDVLMSCLLTFLLFLLIQKLVLKKKVIENE